MIFKVICGFKTSSVKYNNLKEGNAININIIMGIIVQTVSIIVL